MNDTIYRQDAIDTILSEPPDAHYPSWYAEKIKKLPIIEPERQTGEWVEDKYGRVVCSECGRPAPMIMTGCLINRHMEYDKSKFCWNCGADMRFIKVGKPIPVKIEDFKFEVDPDADN